MNPIKQYIKPPQKSNIRSERAFILSEFISEINIDRAGSKYKPVLPVVVAVKTSHLKLPELRDFYKQCWRYKIEGKGTFSKCFFGSIKVK